MNKTLRSLLLIVSLIAVVLSQNQVRVKAAKTVVQWFVGLGTGQQPEQLDKQFEVIRRFNDSQTEIDLRLEMPGHPTATDMLSTLIASGNPPDIIGPVGFAGAHIFAGQWLDLTPLIEKYEVDLSQFEPNVVELYRENGQMAAIPFAVYPGLIYYNADLFDKAGLAYPPTEFGQKYKLDGKEVEWNWDTVAEIAKRMTLDAAGVDATSPDFMPDKIAQFGFVHQWDNMRSDFSTFGGAPVVNEQGKVEIPEHWREAAKWLHNGIWKEHFIPTANHTGSALLHSGNPFASGRVAMARSMLWYTCCLADLKASWDIAVMPSYNGTVYAPTDADTFRIHKDTKNPDAAFKVLQYLLGDAAQELLTVYGGYPARPDLQEELLLKFFRDRSPDVKNWHVVAPSLEFTVVPHHEALVPNFRAVQDRFQDFHTLLYGDTGADIDIDSELDKLEADLQQIVDEAKAMPTEAVDR